jgi:hypothetical protein
MLGRHSRFRNSIVPTPLRCQVSATESAISQRWLLGAFSRIASAIICGSPPLSAHTSRTISPGRPLDHAFEPRWREFGHGAEKAAAARLARKASRTGCK